MTRELVFTATYCEGDNIEKWITEVIAARPHADILVVDDNSPDGTAELVRREAERFSQIRLVVRDGKQGLGTAHLLAMQTALRDGYQVLVTLDADLSHQPSQIQRLVNALPSGGCTVGTRSRGGSHSASLSRRFLSRGANTSARVLLPTGLSEYTSSMRAFAPAALHVLTTAHFRHRGYAFFIECVELLHAAGIELREVPIDFLDRDGGESKIPRSQIFTSAFALISLTLARARKRLR